MERLFAYGTLRPALAPEALRPVTATLRPLGPARLRGRLLDLGPHPGAILEPWADSWVLGEVLELTAASPPLAWFDAYEGYDPDAPSAAAFRRRSCLVECGGARLACWVYEYGGDAGGRRVIESGDWALR